MSEEAREACERRGRLASRLALEGCFLGRLNAAASRRVARWLDRAIPLQSFSEMEIVPASQRASASWFDRRHA